MSSMDDSMKRISSLRYIIEKNFPDKYKELCDKEDMMLDFSVADYQRWVDENIQLEKDNVASIVIYSIVNNRTIEQVVSYLDSKQK